MLPQRGSGCLRNEPEPTGLLQLQVAYLAPCTTNWLTCFRHNEVEKYVSGPPT